MSGQTVCPPRSRATCDCLGCFRWRFDRAGGGEATTAAERRRAHVRLHLELLDAHAVDVRRAPAFSRAGGGWRCL